MKTVNAVVNCDKTHIILRKCDLHQHACLEIFSAQSGLVFDDNGADLARVNIIHHALIAWTVEVCAGVAVVNIVLTVVKIMVISKLFGNDFLIGYTVGFALALILL